MRQSASFQQEQHHDPSYHPVAPAHDRRLRLRKLAPKTQSAYLLHVRRLAAFLHRPPDTATSEDLRRFQLYMVEQGVTSTTLNVTITGLKFFFEVTAHHPELMAKMHPVPVPRKLPQVLSRDEAARLIASACSPKYRAALSVAYGAGLRANEVIALKVTDVDSGRMVLRVEQGKGHKDRYAMLSPALLDCLRIWWKTARAEGKILHGGWLFPGQNPVDPLSTRQLNRAIHAAADLARIDKRVSMYILRHSRLILIMNNWRRHASAAKCDYIVDFDLLNYTDTRARR